MRGSIRFSLLHDGLERLPDVSITAFAPNVIAVGSVAGTQMDRERFVRSIIAVSRSLSE